MEALPAARAVPPLRVRPRAKESRVLFNPAVHPPQRPPGRPARHHQEGCRARLHPGGALQLRGDGQGARCGPEGKRADRPVRPRPAAAPGPGRDLRRGQGTGHHHRDRSLPPGRALAVRGGHPGHRGQAQRGREEGRRIRHPRRLPQPCLGAGVQHRGPDRAGVLRRPAGPGTRPGSGHLLGRRRRPGPGAAAAAPRRPGEVHPHQGRPRHHRHQGPTAGRPGQDPGAGTSSPRRSPSKSASWNSTTTPATSSTASPRALATCRAVPPASRA